VHIPYVSLLVLPKPIFLIPPNTAISIFLDFICALGGLKLGSAVLPLDAAVLALPVVCYTHKPHGNGTTAPSSGVLLGAGTTAALGGTTAAAEIAAQLYSYAQASTRSGTTAVPGGTTTRAVFTGEFRAYVGG
jgi:hypothetical protein